VRRSYSQWELVITTTQPRFHGCHSPVHYQLNYPAILLQVIYLFILLVKLSTQYIVQVVCYGTVGWYQVVSSCLPQISGWESFNLCLCHLLTHLNSATRNENGEVDLYTGWAADRLY